LLNRFIRELFNRRPVFCSNRIGGQYPRATHAINFSHYTYPKLTTIDYPVAEIGQMAARWILKKVYQKPIEELKSLFTPELIVRNSTSSRG